LQIAQKFLSKQTISLTNIVHDKEDASMGILGKLFAVKKELE